MIDQKKEIRKLSPDELRSQLQAKINAIPNPVVSQKEQEKFIDQNRERIRELEQQFTFVKSTIAENDWKKLSSYSDLKDVCYWKKARENGYCENDIAQYYKDLFGIEPKNVVQFLNLMKIKYKIDTLKTEE